MFKVEQQYTKKDLYRILNVPEDQQGGNWNTGYNQYQGNYYLFCNIGVPGRTGHDYDNYWDGDELIWSAKAKTTLHQPSIKSLLDISTNIFVFTRRDSSMPFTYEGRAIAWSYKDITPVQIRWRFKKEKYNTPEISPEEINFNDPLIEGYSKTIFVNKFERNREARRQCIEHFGKKCVICNFDFEEIYGVIGKGFVHVHHVKQLSEIRKEYVVDPLEDLVPVCANCHAIIHKKNPCFTIEEVKAMIKMNLK